MTNRARAAAEERQRAIHQLIEDWLTFPDHRATDFTTLEVRIDRFVADAVAAERERCAKLVVRRVFSHCYARDLHNG